MGESRREVIDPLELYRSKPAAEDFRATIISETTISSPPRDPERKARLA
jgi:hypothetical protein